MYDLKWTTEPPAVPGFYFLRTEKDTRIIVYLCEADINDGRWRGYVEQWKECAGPIPEPKEQV